MASSGGCHALSPRKVYFVEFYMRADVFWLFAFYDLSRSLFKRYNEFQGVILKLNTRVFCCYNICFCTSISSLRILNLVGFPKWLAHLVHVFSSCESKIVLPLLQIINKNNFMFAICTKHVNQILALLKELWIF